MENLNKENFWNGMYYHYPKATKEFCDWIDKYKEQNNWDKLFADGIKFHHIPIEMQFGILVEYQKSFGGCHWETDLMEFDLAEETEEWLKNREADLNI